MAATYTTRQGQTWDDIALEVYGSEKHADYLMHSNFQALNILIFSAGTVLNVPDLKEDYDGDEAPWLDTETDGDEDPYA